MISPEEANLIAALKKSDRAVVREIFLRYHAVLCRVSFRIVNDKEEAKDVVQEVFIKVWQHRESLNIEFSLEAYLRRAVVNTSLNRMESRRKFTNDSLESVFVNQGEPSADPSDEKELSAQLDQALEKLPVRTKAVFTLIRFEDMSYREVAEVLGISMKAVEKEMMKALKLLRVSLKDYLPLILLPLLYMGQ